MNFWLSKRLSIGSVLVLLLAACASNPPTTQNTLAGIWLENSAQNKHCGNTEGSDSQIKLELSVKDKQVTGLVSITLESVTELKGSFSGTQNDDQVTGVITFSNQRKWNADLSLTANTLEGSLTDQIQEPCASSGSDYWTTQVAFLREVTEPVSVDNKEPNNSATQATPIQIEDSFNLSLSPNDIDWFKFSLAQAADIQFDVTLLNAMGLRASILNEEQEQNTLESDSSSLTTQANSWQIKTQLPAGHYFLVITGFDDQTLAGKHQDNGRYTLSFISSKPIADDASEPNNNSTQATPITLDFSKEFYLALEDQDWFSFNLSNSQMLEFRLQAGSGFRATLYSQNLQELFSSDTLAFLPFHQVLSKGKYYLKLTRQTSQGGYYTLGIKTKIVPDGVLEPNNTFDTATPITLDYEGLSYLVSGDEDWYKFTLTEAHIVTFDIGNNYVPGFQLMDASQNDLGANAYYGKVSKYLQSGTFYLRFWGGHDQSIPFNISGVVIPDKANEPNNTLNTATPITLNYTGSTFLYTEDEDWYTFTLSQNRLVTFDFGELFSMNVQLFDAQSNNLNFNYGQLTPVNLGAGTYYLQLHNSYHYQDSPIIPITITEQAPPDSDLEPNNSLNYASNIKLPFSHKVYTSRTDQDWYSFTLPSDLLVTYQLFSESNWGNVQMNVFNSTGQNVGYLYTDFAYDTGPLVTYLKAGQYFLQVFSDSNLPYQFNITQEILPDTSFEPNNTRDQAYAINPGFENSNLIVYALNDNSPVDYDFFKFSLDKTTQLDIRLETLSQGASVSGNITNGNGDHVYSPNTGNPSDVILPAGTYILQVSPGYYQTIKYRLSIKIK